MSILGLTKCYGPITAVDHLTIDVVPGEVYGLLGPNGAGKSTTLRCVMGFARPTQGRVRVLGGDSSAPQVRARIGYLPGDLRLDPRLAAGRIIADVARMRRRAGRSSSPERLIDRLGLDVRRRFGELSRGNRQKIGLVLALMHEPEVLLLDEPTSGLDPMGQEVCLQLLREARERGCAVVLSSHVLSEVEMVADRIGMLRSGRLVLSGPLATILAEAHQLLEVHFVRRPGPSVLAGLPEVHRVAELSADSLLVEVRGSCAEVLSRLAPFGITLIRTEGAELVDIFRHHYGEVL